MVVVVAEDSKKELVCRRSSPALTNFIILFLAVPSAGVRLQQVCAHQSEPLLPGTNELQQRKHDARNHEQACNGLQRRNSTR